MSSDEEIYRSAILKFGDEFQLGMAIEELNELAVELSHYRRGQLNQEHLAEEIADVYIMLEQVKLIAGNKELVETYRSRKMERLGGLV